jgi:hypothetical protein
MLAEKPPTTGERERRKAQRKSAGNGGDVGDKTANHSKKKGKLFQASHCLSGIITTRRSVKTSP